MSDTLDQMRERLDQSRRALAARSDAIGRPPANQSSVFGGTFFPGDRVFDVVTGLEGIVEDSPKLGGGQDRLLAFRVPDGRVLLRPADQLIARPTPPARTNGEPR